MRVGGGVLVCARVLIRVGSLVTVGSLVGVGVVVVGGEKLLVANEHGAGEDDGLLVGLVGIGRGDVGLLGVDDGVLADGDLVGSFDLVGDDAGEVGVDDLFDLEGEGGDDEAEEEEGDDGDEEPEEEGGGCDGEEGDAAGAAGGDLVVGGESAVDHGGGEEGGDGEGVGGHGGEEVGEHRADLAAVEAVLGEGAEEAAEGHDAGQRDRREDEDAEEVFEDVPEEGSAHGVVLSAEC